MGLKYDSHQFKRAGDRLNNSQKAFKRYLIRDMEKLARLVERLARAMAPLETGSLESAIFARVVKEGYTGLRIELSVSGAKPREGNPVLRLAIMRSTWSWASIVSAISPA